MRAQQTRPPSLGDNHSSHVQYPSRFVCECVETGAGLSEWNGLYALVDRSD